MIPRVPLRRVWPNSSNVALDGFKQKTQANLFVGEDQPVKFMRQGKH